MVGADNVITVVQENMGNDEQSNIKPARGIAGFQLDSGNFTTWKVQGKIGGYSKSVSSAGCSRFSALH